MSMDQLACCTKPYMHFRSKGTVKRLIVKDEQETDDAKVFFHENSQSDETSTEPWCPSDAEDFFEKISSIVATAGDFRSFPGECREAASLNVFT